MNRIAFSDNWNGLIKTTSGDGAINIAGKVLSLSSGYLSGVAQVNKFIDPRPGEVINVRCLARKISGTDGQEGRIAICYPTALAPKNQIKIKSKSWQKYSLRFAVPHTHNNRSDFLNIIFSTNNEDSGKFEFTEVEITTEQCGIPSVNCFASAKIKMLKGVPEINDKYQSFGIVSMTYDGNQLTIQTDYTFQINKFFIPHAIAQHDGQLSRKLQIGCGMERFGLGRIYINFYDSAGNIVDLRSDSYPEIGFSVMVMGT